MVRDLGKDYYKLNGSELDALTERVKSGDMEQVLRVYEQEMQVCPLIGTRRVISDDSEPAQERLDG